jgi:hypothetical protein
LDPIEKRLDDPPIRQQTGKGADGRVAKGYQLPEDWRELADVERWFSVTIREPKYESDRDVNITVEYRQRGKDYDIIAGGSGFHQTLTLLAFLYGYSPPLSCWMNQTPIYT